ncbi:hypothetical protein [Novosphingopyxis sp. YJ-S2-01]|uniref:hypothetical protein n=1 Tax=Novosphingopyxis sp. YJ-S2-01 TaxID=2794021 RepID=UPI0018DD354A|nr:hypothetical protein [Novosphingopyxis sp. YJ-S2-01]MBH9537080.1 hypothetical protein [Novosphingopyxis sp. YJ-S2-01]
MYAVEVEQPARIILLNIGAELSTEEAWGLQKAKNDAVESLGPPYADHARLMDVSKLRIQPQEIIQAFVEYSLKTHMPSRRVAIMVGEGTSKMQFRRIVQKEGLRDDMQLFSDREEALGWLRDTCFSGSDPSV